MQFCLYELSQNKEIQEKARQDVAAAIKKHGEISYEALSDMKYLEQCIEGEFSV
jgi:cytochrome P450 family 6